MIESFHTADADLPETAAAPPAAPVSTEETADGDEVRDASDAPREIRYAKLGDLVLEYKHWTNPRSQTGLDDESIKALGESILAGTTHEAAGEGDESTTRTYAGIRVPLEVVQIEVNGEVVQLVIDGQRRHLGAQSARLPDDALIPVIDLESAPVQWTRELANYYLFRALDAVGTRAGLSSYELAQNALRLRTGKDPATGKEYTLAKIAKAIGRSESWVSRILAALASASPKLVHRWQTGELTDEQFKDIASVKGDKDAVADRVVEAKQAGDKGGARTLAKEQKLIDKAKAPAPSNTPGVVAGKVGKTMGEVSRPVVRGPQASLPGTDHPVRKPPSFVVVEDFLGLEKTRPPVHDHVRGFMEGVRWAAGLLDASKFSKPMQTYIQRGADSASRRDTRPSKRNLTGSKRKAATPDSKKKGRR